MKSQTSRSIGLRIKSLAIRAGAAIAPLLMMVVVGGAQPAEAAGSTIVVAPTPTPTNCGKFQSATTDLDGVLSTAKKGTILLCPGNYNSNGQIRITHASHLTIKAAVKNPLQAPRVVFSNTAEFGLFVDHSNNVTIDGLDLDASANTHVFYAMIAAAESGLTVRNTVIIGSLNVFNYGIQFENNTSKSLKLSVLHSEMHNCAQGINVSGKTGLSVQSSLIDGENIARGTTNTGIVASADATTRFFPTGLVSKSIIRDNNVGILVDGSRLNITRNTFTGNTDFDIHVDQVGDINPVFRNNRITQNSFVVEDGATGIVVSLSGDPASAKLLNTTISGNTLRAVAPGNNKFGIVFLALVGPAPKSLTGTLSGNTLTDFSQGNEILNINNWAALKLKHNIIHGPVN